MILPEEDAKTKRCQESFPAATGLSVGGAAFPTTWQPLPPNCGGAGYAVHTAPLMCIGSACMAWRWHQEPPTISDNSHSMAFSVARGFCGKAGKP